MAPVAVHAMFLVLYIFIVYAPWWLWIAITPAAIFFAGVGVPEKWYTP